MSIDGLGRIIVGSGHFVEKAPGIIEMTQKVVVGGGHFVNGIQVLGAAGERASQALNASRQVQALVALPAHVPVGGGHFIKRSIPVMQCFADANGNLVNMVLCGAHEDAVDREWNRQSSYNDQRRWEEEIQKQQQEAEKFRRYSAWRDHHESQFKKLEKMGWNTAQAIGWGMSGDYGAMLEKCVDAGMDLAEITLESLRWSFEHAGK